MKICSFCNNKIERKSPKAKYCSSSCKYKAYRYKNPDRIKETQEKYNKNNYEKRLETWRKYRLKSGRSRTLWTENLTNTCIECGKKFHPKKFQPYMKFCTLNCGSRYNQRKWKRENPGRIKEIMKKYDSSKKGKARRSKRYEKIKIYQKEWLKKNPKKIAIYSKSYRERDPERAKRNRKKYAKSIKGIFSNRKRSHIYRMLIKRNYNHNNLIPVLMQQDNKCPLCGSKYSLNLENMELAHIYPMSRYPTLAADTRNIIPICKKCNRKMHNKKFDEYCMENNVPIPERVYKYIKQKENILSFIENNRRT